MTALTAAEQARVAEIAARLERYGQLALELSTDMRSDEYRVESARLSSLEWQFGHDIRTLLALVGTLAERVAAAEALAEAYLPYVIDAKIRQGAGVHVPLSDAANGKEEET